MRKFVIVCAATVFTCWIWSATRSAEAADTVELRCGATLVGEVVAGQKVKSGPVIIDLGTKRLTLERDAVVKITLDKAARREYAAKLRCLAKDNAQGRFALYRRLTELRLFSTAKKELAAVIAVAPNFAPARRAAGHVFRDGCWFSPQEIAAQKARRRAAETAKENEKRAAERQKQTAERLAFAKETLRKAKLLGRKDIAASKKERVLYDYKHQPDKVVPVLAEALSAVNVPDPDIRRGALASIKELNPKNNRRVGTMLARSALQDPEKELRTAAAKVIKTTNNKAAVGSLLQSLLGSFDAAGNVAVPKVHAAAAEALRSIDDTAVYETLLYYVVLELRTTRVKPAGFQQRQIDAYTVNSGANANLVLKLSFPIQFPELKIERVRTTVCVPAAALRSISGQDFGDDIGRWRNWIAKH